ENCNYRTRIHQWCNITNGCAGDADEKELQLALEGTPPSRARQSRSALPCGNGTRMEHSALRRRRTLPVRGCTRPRARPPGATDCRCAFATNRKHATDLRCHATHGAPRIFSSLRRTKIMSPRDVSQAIESQGVGWFTIRMVLLSALVMIVDGYDLSVVAY